jgi:integrase
MHQRQASPNTIASYRDTFRLLLQFAQQQVGKPPTKLTMQVLEPAFLGAFLNHLERDRGVCARSRNVRLAAIHSFFRFVAFTEPTFAALAQRVLAIPNKRYDRRPIEYLTRPEIERYSLLLIELRGEAAGITPCCSSPLRPGSAYRNSLVFVAMTLSWEPEVQCGVEVKDARSAPRRCVKMWW